MSDAGRTRRLSTIILGAVLVTAIAGCSGTPVVIADAWARSNPNGMGAAYLSITMPTDDRLIGAEVATDVAGRVEVHEVIDDAGRMLMREVEGGIPLPAGTTVELRPGGYHLMLLDMPAMLPTGSSIDITLLFAEASPIVVSAQVREGAASGVDSDGVDHGTMHGSHGGMPGGSKG